MATAKERLKIFENVISRIGVDGDVLGEYSKAMATLNGLQTYQEMNPPQPPMPPMGNTPQPQQQTQSQVPLQPVTQPMEGNGTLFLPPVM